MEGELKEIFKKFTDEDCTDVIGLITEEIVRENQRKVNFQILTNVALVTEKGRRWSARLNQLAIGKTWRRAHMWRYEFEDVKLPEWVKEEFCENYLDWWIRNRLMFRHP